MRFITDIKYQTDCSLPKSIMRGQRENNSKFTILILRNFKSSKILVI